MTQGGAAWGRAARATRRARNWSSIVDQTNRNPTASTAFDAVDSAVDQAADAAATVRDTASRMAANASERAAEFGQQAAERVNRTTAYFREHDMKDVVGDMKAYTRSHPAQILLGAVALGFLMTVLIRRS
jgi:ElaB/YqjD/DUF883 family membrane-anchored ribosome-binding protein